jgi:hypothetical protein
MQVAAAPMNPRYLPQGEGNEEVAYNEGGGGGYVVLQKKNISSVDTICDKK